MNTNINNWHKSSYSGGDGEDCVEQGFPETGGAAVRDTKLKGTSPILEFTGEAWASFVADVRKTATV